MYSLLFLSFLTGILEVGCVLWGIKQNLSIAHILLFPIAYQTGNLLGNIQYFKKKSLRIAFITLIPTLFLGSFLWNWNLVYAYVLCISFSLNTVRNEHKSECSINLKRFCRVAGFLAAVIIPIFPWSSLACFGIILMTYLCREPNYAKKTGNVDISTLHTATMVFHQMHYFCYTYIILVILMKWTESTLNTSVLFAVSWIVYMLPNWLGKSYGKKHPRIMFFACHIFLLAVLVGMSIAWHFHNMYSFIIFWLATGIGGGSVFCIPLLKEGAKEQIKMDASENTGHILGCISAWIVASIPLTISLETLLISISACFVFITLLCAVLFIMYTEK